MKNWNLRILGSWKWRQQKTEEGQVCLVSHLSNKTEVFFFELFLLSCCCFNMVQPPGTGIVGQDITLCAEIVYWSLLCLLYQIVGQTSSTEVVCHYRSRCLFMDLVKLNWMFCFLK